MSNTKPFRIGFLRVDPMGKPRLNRSDSWKNKDGTFKRKCVNDWYDFKDKLKEEVLKDGVDLTGYTHLDITWFIKMPKSWSKKKKEEMTGKLHDQKPDIDNLEKAFLDSVLKEDKKIAAVNKMKLWSTRGGISFKFHNG